VDPERFVSLYAGQGVDRVKVLFLNEHDVHEQFEMQGGRAAHARGALDARARRRRCCPALDGQAA
jgi:hypothetical protein